MPVDPGLAALLETMPRISDSDDPSEAAAIRAGYSTRLDPALLDPFRKPVRQVVDSTVPGRGDDIPVRVYRPATTAPHGTLVYFHGGGWVLGNVDTHDLPCRQLCVDLAMTVVSVDYRLAPEHPFPAGIEDAVDATKWALTHVAELGGDAERVVIGGDSAGANFAAVVAQELRDEPIAAQLLIYPATDLSTEYPSSALIREGLVLDETSVRLFERCYLPDSADRTDPRVSPLRAEDLAELPPAVVITAQFDPLRDEGDAYAKALREAGNVVSHQRFPSLTHGFLSFGPFVPACQAAVDETIEMVRALLKPQHAQSMATSPRKNCT